MQYKTFKLIYFIYIFIIFVGGATKLVESDLLIFITFALSFYLYITTKSKFDINILLLLCLFGLINLFSVIVLGPELNINAYIGFNLRILTVYFSIKYFGWDFFRYYSKGIFIIALISVPLYTIQLFDVNFYINNFPGINMSGELRTSVNYWNCFIYTAHQGKYNDIIRNSGFGIEPGHFGFLIGLGMLLELIKTNFKINRRFVFLTTIGFSTFSSTFFIILALLILLYQLNNHRRFLILSLVQFAAIFFGVYLILTADIVTQKIKTTVETTDYQSTYDYESKKGGDVLNRFGMIKVGFENFLKYPMGYGLNEAGLKKNSSGEIIAGPNPFVHFTIQWGVFFIIFFPFALFRFIKLASLRITESSKVVILAIFAIWANSSIQSLDFIFFSIMILSIIRLKAPESLSNILNYKSSIQVKHKEVRRVSFIKSTNR